MNTSHWEIPTFETTEFEQKKRDYCIVIPIINEGERIQNQLKRILEADIQSHADVIIADGGSTDGSTAEEILRPLGVRTLLVKTGSGKLSAQLRMAYSYALQQGYEGIVTVDGNGKDGVEAIPQFIEELKNGGDFIQGSRFIPGGKAINTPFIRWAAIRFVHAPILSLAARFWYTDTTNGFRGYSKKLLLDERVAPFRNIFSTYELLAYLSVRAPRLGMITKEIPVTRAYPDSGKIPTKINHLGHLDLLQILWKCLIGGYNPKN